MISKSDGGSDWGEFRNDKGEFRQWLQVWAYINLHDRRTPWAPLPWVCKEAPSGEFMEAMYHVGLTKRWPGQWPRWRPVLLNRGALPIYGIILPRHTDAALAQHLVSLRRQCVSDADFKVRLRRYILSKQEMTDANTRSG